MERGPTEAQKFVWRGAIPLQIHLHDSEVTTLPPPPPVLILAPRIGYLPLLVSQIRPLFSSALPPGNDTVWFEYKGLPLKWYIPTGVLFDLLCAEPERPWNITVHFRGYPANILTPCDDDDTVKWSFINSLKEAAYIITGNCKTVMNMSQSDQAELWSSVLNGNSESFLRVSSKLRLGTVEDEYTAKLTLSSVSRHSHGNADVSGSSKTGRVPVRLYAYLLKEGFDDLENAPEVDSWDMVSYINRPVETSKFEGKCFTLRDAMKILMPEYFGDKSIKNDKANYAESEDTRQTEASSERANALEVNSAIDPCKESEHSSQTFETKLIRIQGIEPKLEIPFSWVVNNLMNPDHFLHICVYAKCSS
ncbi:hypothetical protein V2J09_001148 [Rumex salicifolius]